MGFDLDSENTTQHNIIFGDVDSFLAYLATETMAGKIKAAASPLLPLQPATFMEAASQTQWWI